MHQWLERCPGWEHLVRSCLTTIGYNMKGLKFPVVACYFSQRVRTRTHTCVFLSLFLIKIYNVNVSNLRPVCEHVLCDLTVRTSIFFSIFLCFSLFLFIFCDDACRSTQLRRELRPMRRGRLRDGSRNGRIGFLLLQHDRGQRHRLPGQHGGPVHNQRLCGNTVPHRIRVGCSRW